MSELYVNIGRPTECVYMYDMYIGSNHVQLGQQQSFIFRHLF